MRTTVPYLQKRFFAGRFPGAIVQPPPGTVGVTASFGAVNVNAAAATAVTFVISKSPDIILSRVVVAWSIAGTGVNPVTGGDFAGAVLPGNTIVIPAGTPSVTVTVTFSAETPPAADRTGHLTLAVVSGAALDPAGNGFDFQVNKIGANSTVRISSFFSTVDVTNGGTTTETFVISKSVDLLGTSVAVPWALTATGANPVTGADFQGGVLPSGTVTIAAGSPSATVSVVFAAEAPPASAETGHVAISAPVGITVDPLAGSFDFQVNASGATGLVGISANFATVDVVASGTTAKTFTIAKSPDILNSAVTVPWTLTGVGTNPVHGSDFQAGTLPSGTATLGIGTPTATVTITFAAEAPPSIIETGHVALGTPTGASLDTAHSGFDFQVNAASIAGKVGVSVAFSAVDVAPGGTTAVTVTVSKTSDIQAEGVTVPWAVTGTGASPVRGSDFVGGVLPTGSLVIPAGNLSADITLTFAAEAPPVAAETGLFALGLPTVGPAAVPLFAQSFPFQINAQVIQPPQTTIGVASSFSSVTVNASGQTVATVDVAKAGVTNIACTVDWAVTPDPSAANPIRAADFASGVFPSGTLSIGAGLTHKALSLTFVAEAPPANDLGGVFTLSNPTPAANVQLDTANSIFSFIINKVVIIAGRVAPFYIPNLPSSFQRIANDAALTTFLNSSPNLANVYALVSKGVSLPARTITQAIGTKANPLYIVAERNSGTIGAWTPAQNADFTNRADWTALVGKAAFIWVDGFIHKPGGAGYCYDAHSDDTFVTRAWIRPGLGSNGVQGGNVNRGGVRAFRTRIGLCLIDSDGRSGNYGDIDQSFSRNVATNPDYWDCYLNDHYPTTTRAAALQGGMALYAEPGVQFPDNAPGDLGQLNSFWRSCRVRTTTKFGVYIKHNPHIVECDGAYSDSNNLIIGGSHVFGFRGNSSQSGKMLRLRAQCIAGADNDDNNQAICLQSFHHELGWCTAIGGSIKVFCLCTLATDKPLQQARYADIHHCNGRMVLGAIRIGWNPTTKLQNVVIAAHTGAIVDNDSNPVTFNGATGQITSSHTWIETSGANACKIFTNDPQGRPDKGSVSLNRSDVGPGSSDTNIKPWDGAGQWPSILDYTGGGVDPYALTQANMTPHLPSDNMAVDYPHSYLTWLPGGGFEAKAQNSPTDAPHACINVWHTLAPPVGDCEFNFYATIVDANLTAQAGVDGIFGLFRPRQKGLVAYGADPNGWAKASWRVHPTYLVPGSDLIYRDRTRGYRHSLANHAQTAANSMQFRCRICDGGDDGIDNSVDLTPTAPSPVPTNGTSFLMVQNQKYLINYRRVGTVVTCVKTKVSDGTQQTWSFDDTRLGPSGDAVGGWFGFGVYIGRTLRVEPVPGTPVCVAI